MVRARVEVPAHGGLDGVRFTMGDEFAATIRS
jgi:hypothetical protein